MEAVMDKLSLMCDRMTTMETTMTGFGAQLSTLNSTVIGMQESLKKDHSKWTQLGLDINNLIQQMDEEDELDDDAAHATESAADDS
jgi:hypothetical protein